MKRKKENTSYSVQYWKDFKFQAVKIQKPSLRAVKAFCKKQHEKEGISGNFQIFNEDTNESHWYSPRVH